MSRYGTPFCSDEELLEELGKLGYDEVSEDVFNMMKDDLSELVEKEQKDPLQSDYDSRNSPVSSPFITSDALIEHRTTKESSKKSDPSVSRKVKKKSHNAKSKTSNESDAKKQVSEISKPQNTKSGRKMKSSKVSAELDNSRYDDALSDLDVSENKYTSLNGQKSIDNYSELYGLKSDVNRNEDSKYDYNAKSFSSRENDFQLNYSPNSDKLSLKSEISLSKYQSNASKDSKYASAYGKSYDKSYSLSAAQKTDNPHKNVKDAFKTFKLEKNYSESNEPLLYNYKGSDLNLNTSQSSTSSETKTIKRKVLRRRNGRSVITEEIVEIPSIFDTSYPDSETFNNSKSFSSDDLSSKSNSSTGSITTRSPESSIKSSPSTFSLLSTRSTSLRVSNSRKKKSDPVAMYGYYRKYWDNFKPPGENTHDRLRWAVRDKMLDYNI